MVGREITLRVIGEAPPAGLQVGVQRRSDVERIVDADGAPVTLEVAIELRGATEDFAGPYVHGGRGDRFIYLVWGTTTTVGAFKRCARTKLFLSRTDAAPFLEAAESVRSVEARVPLTDERGRLLTGGVAPELIAWRVV